MGVKTWGIFNDISKRFDVCIKDLNDEVKGKFPIVIFIKRIFKLAIGFAKISI